MDGNGETVGMVATSALDDRVSAKVPDPVETLDKSPADAEMEVVGEVSETTAIRRIATLIGVGVVTAILAAIFLALIAKE